MRTLWLTDKLTAHLPEILGPIVALMGATCFAIIATVSEMVLEAVDLVEICSGMNKWIDLLCKKKTFANKLQSTCLRHYVLSSSSRLLL